MRGPRPLMTTISIQCVHCHKRYNPPATMAGKKVKCKHCGKVFAIPTTATPTDGAPGLSMVGDEAHDTANGTKSGTQAGAKTGSRTGGAVAARGTGGEGKLGSASAGYASKMNRSGDVGEFDLASDSAPS